jgi:hypothetical protein
VSQDTTYVKVAHASDYVRKNDRRWMAISIAIAIGGVIGMGHMANAGYDAGREVGTLEGRSDVISAVGLQSIECTPLRDANDKIMAYLPGSDCPTIHKSYKELVVQFRYGEQHHFTKSENWFDRWFAGRG